MVDLSIIIVNWNGEELLKKCLASIAKSRPNTSFEVLVIDNASTDNSVPWLKSEGVREFIGEDKLHIIENKENLGFSKANNQGIVLSKSRLVLLLNSDTEVLDGAIDALIARIDSDPKIGACGPKLLNSDGTLQPSVFCNPPTPWELLINGLRFYKLLPNNYRGTLLLGPFWNHNEVKEVSFVSGAAIMIKREVIARVGGLDESFHMYGEDIELCLRIVRNGWKLLFEPSSRIIHYGGTSSKRRWNNYQKAKVQTQGFLQFQEKSLSPSHVLANVLSSYFVLSLERRLRAIRRIPVEDVNAPLDVYRGFLKNKLKNLF